MINYTLPHIHCFLFLLVASLSCRHFVRIFSVFHVRLGGIHTTKSTLGGHADVTDRVYQNLFTVNSYILKYLWIFWQNNSKGYVHKTERLRHHETQNVNEKRQKKCSFAYCQHQMPYLMVKKSADDEKNCLFISTFLSICVFLCVVRHQPVSCVYEKSEKDKIIRNFSYQ